MNNLEFNKKYEKFIENRFIGLEFSESEVIKFLDNLFENTLTKIPGFTFSQIKLKFGMARVYTNLEDDYIGYMIESHIDEIFKGIKEGT